MIGVTFEQFRVKVLLLRGVRVCSNFTAAQVPIWFCVACPVVLGLMAPFLFNLGSGAVAQALCDRLALPPDECNDVWCAPQPAPKSSQELPKTFTSLWGRAPKSSHSNLSTSLGCCCMWSMHACEHWDPDLIGPDVSNCSTRVLAASYRFWVPAWMFHADS